MDAKIRKRIGEFLILLIYLMIDAFEIWPRSHSLALLAVVAGIVALMLLDGEFSYKSIITVGLIVSVPCVTIDFLAPPILPNETEIIGTLQPGNEPTPHNSCDKNPSPATPDMLKILMGTNAFISVPNPGKIVAVEIGNGPNACQVLAMEKIGANIKVAAELYDQNGSSHALPTINSTE